MHCSRTLDRSSPSNPSGNPSEDYTGIIKPGRSYGTTGHGNGWRYSSYISTSLSKGGSSPKRDGMPISRRHIFSFLPNEVEREDALRLIWDRWRGLCSYRPKGHEGFESGRITKGVDFENNIVLILIAYIQPKTPLTGSIIDPSGIYPRVHFLAGSEADDLTKAFFYSHCGSVTGSLGNHEILGL